VEHDFFALGGCADPVLVLDAERRRLMQAAGDKQDAAEALLARARSSGIGSYPKIHVGRLLTGPGDAYKPIFAYSEVEIRAHCKKHRSARAATWGDAHPSVLGLVEVEERLVAELRTQTEAYRAMRESSGVDVLEREATELFHAFYAVEDRLMATVATSVDGLLVQLEIFCNDVKWNDVPEEKVDAQFAIISAGIRAIGGAA